MQGETIKIEKIDEPEDGIGIFTYLERYKEPYKGFPNEKIVEKNAVLKRCVISTIKFLTSKKPFVFLFPFLVLMPPFMRRQLFDSFISWISELYGTAFRPHFPDPKRLCQSGREINRVGELMIKDIKPEGKYRRYQDFLRTILLIWEFDNSYRYRGQDVFSELNKENLFKNPRKEIVRLFKIGLSREQAGLSNEDKKYLKGLGVEVFDVSMKWKLLVKLLSLTLFFSNDLTVLFFRFFAQIKVEEFKFDNSDWYWVCERCDYDYGGKPFWERYLERLRIDEKYLQTLPPIEPPKAQVVLIPNDYFYQLPRLQAENVISGLMKQVWDGYDKKRKEFE